MSPQEIGLYGGTTVQIRPASTSDVTALQQMHERLSRESLIFRYHGPRQPTAKQLRQFCSSDDKNAAYVISPIEDRTAVIGIGQYVRIDADELGAAEVAFLIEDRFQGYGLGKRLFAALYGHALVADVKQFLAYVQPANFAMMRLFYNCGLALNEQYIYGAREIRMTLT